MSDATERPGVWVLADPRAGTAAQALGISERLGVPFRVLPLEWGPLARLPIPWPSLLGLAPAARQGLRDAALEGPRARMAARGPGWIPRIVPEWPGLVISAGRRAAPVSRWLRRRGARTVHAMRPGPGQDDFDLLVIGRHDAVPPAPNVMEIRGACHRLSPARLAEARAEWGSLAALPAPRAALLLGGPVRGEGMAPEEALAVLRATRRRLPGASLLVSASRRTGRAAEEAVAGALAGTPHRLFRWGEPGPNPYAGFLAWAEAAVVTADSVSMLSEAASTGAILLIAGRAEGRHAALAESLVASGHAAWLDGTGPAQAPEAPLDETGRVAALIRDRGWIPG